MKLAECYLTQCGENGVPVWDFRLPTDQPARHCGRMAEWPHWDVTDPANCTRNVDTSAAAIMACGMLEFLAKEEHAGMRSYVDAVTRTLTVQYMNTDEGCAGLLHSQNGNASYTSFGDYYLMELLARQLGSDILPW